jgi:putative two-component system response regulator
VNQDKEKSIILVVDDTPDNIEVLRWVLIEDYQVMAATHGKKALKIAQGTPKPDLILLDVMMPDLDGYDICRKLKSDPRTSKIPVIFLTTKDETENEKMGLEIGAVDYIHKPIKPSIVQARVRTHLNLYKQNRLLEKKVLERTAELHETRLEITQRLGRAAEFRDNETGMHVIRMGHYARLIASALGVDDEWADMILHAAPMHDVGKIGIPDKILLKPGKLSPAEWEIMKTHSTIGGKIFSEGTSRIMKMSQSIALTHHEKWDGSGYPEGLKGEEIPLEGRIVAVADVFDALISQRPYKEAWPVEKSVRLIEMESGKHFDPQVAQAFKKVLPDILEIKDRFADRPESIEALT